MKCMLHHHSETLDADDSRANTKKQWIQLHGCEVVQDFIRPQYLRRFPPPAMNHH